MYKYQKSVFSIKTFYSRCGLVPLDNKLDIYILYGRKATSVLKQSTKRVFKPTLVKSGDDY